MFAFIFEFYKAKQSKAELMDGKYGIKELNSMNDNRNYQLI